MRFGSLLVGTTCIDDHMFSGVDLVLDFPVDAASRDNSCVFPLKSR